jgi:hypothetical protein
MNLFLGKRGELRKLEARRVERFVRIGGWIVSWDP